MAGMKMCLYHIKNVYFGGKNAKMYTAYVGPDLGSSLFAILQKVLINNIQKRIS